MTDKEVSQNLDQDTGLISPKEAFELAVQMEREKRKRIMIAENKANDAYKRWLWGFLEVEEVGI